MSVRGSLVSAEWLKAQLDSVILLDASWFLGAGAYSLDAVCPGCSSAEEAYSKKRIASARIVFGDLANCIDKSSEFSMMLPPKDVFENHMRRLNIQNADTIVVYDQCGMFSSPRLWFTLKYFGHKNVFVLDGGLPAWEKSGGLTVGGGVGAPEAETRGSANDVNEFYTVPDGYPLTSMTIDLAGVRANREETDAERLPLVDTRPAASFSAGHVPKSLNVPFPEFLQVDEETGAKLVKPTEQLKTLFEAQNIDPLQPYIASCGSGVTACHLVLMTDMLGADISKVHLYDGSWNQYGRSGETVEQQLP